MSEFIRHIQLPEIGELGQKKISKSRVVIIGCGGLGAIASWYLAASGIKKLTLIDGDIISKSNLPRQVLFSVVDLGKLKVDVAKLNLSYQYPNLEIQTLAEYFDSHKHTNFLENNDIILDCTDNLKSKFDIETVCKNLKLPLIATGISVWELQVMASNIALAGNKRSASYFDVFEYNSETENPIDDCNINGVLSTTAGLGGLLQSHVTLLAITNSYIVANKLFVFNTLNFSFNTIDINYESKISNSTTKSENKELEDSIIFIGQEIPEDLKNKNLKIVPYYQLEEFLLENPNYHSSYLACETGKKSEIMASKLNKQFNYNLKSIYPI